MPSGDDDATSNHAVTFVVYRGTMETTMTTIEESDIWRALKDVKDPEIPTISVVDMGIIIKVDVQSPSDVTVIMTPTFTGCPAIDVMRADVEQAVRNLGVSNVHVSVTYDTPWSTSRLTDEGRAALLRHGLALPAILPDAGTEPTSIVLSLDVLSETACPYCGSHNTTVKSPFGPTLCRSLHYCNACLQAFEGFKPV